jgi:ADP-ribose pyrophosphatase
MPPRPWKTLSTRMVYQNPWTLVREDVVRMPNGKDTIYGVIECGDCVGVLPFIDADHVVMVRQYRYVFKENHRWEMPTGGVKPGESLEQAARRELREEAGYQAGELKPLNSYFTSKSVMFETAHLFTARGLSQVEGVPDETEFLEVRVFPFSQVLEMVLQSEIRDSMTVIAVLLADRLRNLGQVQKTT